MYDTPSEGSTGWPTHRDVAHEAGVGHGHRRIAFVGDAGHLYTTRRRLQGYREAVQGAGLGEISRVGACDAAAEVTRELLELPDPPTAVFAMNNLITVGVLQALDKARVSIPYDVAFIGFDDFELAAVLHPRLTLVRQPAAELVFDRLNGKWTGRPRRLVSRTQLIVRESCGCSPLAPGTHTDHPWLAPDANVTISPGELTPLSTG